MKKILLVLMVLLFALPVWGKVLVITSNSQVDVVSATSLIEECFAINMRTGGVTYDVVLCSDSTTLWDKAISGDYQIAIALHLPDFTASPFYDKGSELDAVGWWRLDDYVNRSDSLAFPIPLIIPMPVGLTSLGCWADSVSGQMGVVPHATYWAAEDYTGEDQPLTNANGDSLFLRTHATTLTNPPRIATNDSLAWCYPLVWYNCTQPATGQVVCPIWMTKGTGNHRVIYVYYAAISFQQGFIMSLIAGWDSDFQDLEVCEGLYNFGYNAAGNMTDTTSLGTNLKDIETFVVAEGVKLDIGIDTYHWAVTQADSMRGKYLFVEDWPVDHPDNFRFFPQGARNWGNNSYWTSYAADLSQATMETYIGNSIDSIENASSLAGRDGLATAVVTDRYICYENSGTFRYNIYGDIDEVLKALLKKGVNKLYIMGGVSTDISPSNTYRHLHYPVKTRIKYDATTYYDLELYAWAWNGGSQIAGASDTDQPTIANRGTLNAVWLKRLCGFYVTNLDAGPNSDGVKWGTYRPGMMMDANYLGNDNNVLEVMQAMNSYMDAMNYMVTEYGNGTRSSCIGYAWMDDVKWDRYLNRQWHSDHVTR